ncbi:MAG TPA: PorV/PorQ family protein [Candidatus Marinimicrobia bacterium]|nr:PorV/PorQ family protein [Candidatus Neomarinimicrobiota bacterium]
MNRKQQKLPLRLILIALFCVSISNLWAQLEEEYTELIYTGEVNKKGSSSAQFLEIGIGARALSMGSAFTAVANDVTALYWNPAGITQIDAISVTGTHTEWFADMSLDHAAGIVPMGNGQIVGFSLSVFNAIDKQTVRTVTYPEGTGEYYSASDLALAMTYGLKITDRFACGLTGKYVRQQIWHMSSAGYAVDIGLLYKTQLKGLNLGASISNFGTDMRLAGRDVRRAHDEDPIHYSNDKINAMLETDAFPMPLLFRFGLAYSFSPFKYNDLTLAVDLLHPSNNVEYLNVGCEYALAKLFFLRIGYEALFDQEAESGLSFGAGINYKLFQQTALRFDYAIVDWGRLAYVQHFTVGLSF